MDRPEQAAGPVAIATHVHRLMLRAIAGSTEKALDAAQVAISCRAAAAVDDADVAEAASSIAIAQAAIARLKARVEPR